ncbi:MAG: hypothetical protein NZ839_03980, partial [Endomicrobia bacterium]|nr:hypothetical protein [Endomicrobiia bacterium]
TESDNAAVRTQLNALNEEIKKLRETMSIEKQEYDRIKLELEQKNKEIFQREATYKETVAKFNSQLDQLKAMFEDEKKKIEQYYNEKISELQKQHESTIEKIDLTWKEVYAKVLSEHREMEKKLNTKEEEIAKLKSRLETVMLANEIKNKKVVEYKDTGKVITKNKPSFASETKIVDNSGKKKSKVFILKKIWLWLSKPVLKI